ncbi:MAG TPA: GNAT family protein [Gemmatimonadaceae bacterium]|nr:GNAT family protein [Gemmatimonadaceae bacterium]
MEIVTAACRLRPLAPTDAESLARHANDRGIWLNLRDRFPHPYTLEDARSYIAHVAGQEPATSLAIEVDGSAVGGISLMPGHDIERVSAEIGYWIGRAYWGRGIATAAIRGATGYALTTLGFRRVFAVPFVRNAASVRALEKAGYVREGVMRRSAVKDGALLDQYLYAAYDDRWTA